MTQDHIICLPGKRARTPIWYRVVDGAVVQRGYGFDWRPSDDDAPTGRFLIVLPPEATSLHWIACPDMTLRQGASAARVMALEASIGSPDDLHAVVQTSPDPQDPHIVAVASRADMIDWFDWCAEHGIGEAQVVPGALLLPPPDEGFVAGRVGEREVVRGVDSAFDRTEGFAAQLIGDQSVIRLPEDRIGQAMVDALDVPPLDLRQGIFAPRKPRLFPRDRLARMAIMVGFIALASLLIALITIARLNLDASRLDARTVTLARTVDPNVSDATQAQRQVAAKLAARGGLGGFTGVMAGVMSAMQANPSVIMTSVSQDADGSLRVRLAANDAKDINDVLLAIQEAGWRISANAVQQSGARMIADITVVRS